MIKNDNWLLERASQIIDPFEPSLVAQGKISYGVSSFGYDFRLADEFRSFEPPIETPCVDPKQLREAFFHTERSMDWMVPPHGFILARSLEYFRIPRNVLGFCTGKSTYSRCGVFVTITPLEPEWEGHVTFPICNLTPFPVRIYAGEGIAQVVFLEGAPPRTSYADRKGKYQRQTAVTLSKV
ncbi:MAG: dCTP deaminase [bacterium]